MILYSITFNIEETSHDTWMEWMKQTYIPTLKKSGLLADNKFYKLLTEVDHPGVTYSLQCFLKNQEDYENFTHNYQDVIDVELYNKFNSQFVEFRTLLESVDL